MTISLDGLDKAAVLAALYNSAKPLGLGFLRHDPKPMSVTQAKIILDTRDDLYFDYLYGCPLKINLNTDEIDPRLYNRDNGENAAEEVIAALRTQDTTP